MIRKNVTKNRKPEPEPEPGPDPKPLDPITKWPPTPKGGSNKPERALIIYEGSVFQSEVSNLRGVPFSVSSSYRSRYAAHDFNPSTNEITISKSVNTSYGANSSVTEKVNLYYATGADGMPYPYYSETVYVKAIESYVRIYHLSGGILFVDGTEKIIENFADTLNYQRNYSYAGWGGPGGRSIYSATSYAYSDKYNRLLAKFVNSSYSYNVPSGWESRPNDSIAGTYSEIHRVKSIIYIDRIPKKQPKNSPLQPDKKMDKDCCEKLEKLLKRLSKYQGLGQKIKPINVKDNKIEEKGGKDENFPMKIPKRWIDREAKPKDDYEVQNMRHLILSVGIMLDRFEELFNPAGKDKGFPLKKPEEGIWKWLPGDGGDYEAPDPNYDPKKSKDDGKIKNKKLKINSYLDLFRYFLESQIRLELLFPIAQIRDSEISKRLIYPKAPGTIKINDLIQFQELMLLFINKTLGDPSGAVIIKDADPTQEGAQPLTIENFDISDMLRKLLRFSVDINSDIDLTNNFSKRTLYQLLSAMQVLVKNHEMTEAIFEDLGMKEEQSFVPVKFFADPYAGAWGAGKGFDPAKIKVENSEANIEANLEAFLQEKEVEVKVSRRAKDETTDIRDLLAQIGRYAAELAAQGKIPNNPEAIQQAIDKARFELQTESAIRRTDVRQASAAGRVRNQAK
ncbi:MAG: hypothetical protein RSE13_26245 [Planktothrix sp. GU0601_MAG3]|nr:MAG: hypothetical protein RSE13_26245 [Planktothrix sp. GU0601_MAG3]